MKRLLTLVFLIACVHLAWKHLAGTDQGGRADISASELKALASSVSAEQVVMYSTTECPHCAEAKAWLGRYGFAFTECNMSVERRCEREFMQHGGKGTPYLVVRGHHMSDGFDSDEFVARLRQ